MAAVQVEFPFSGARKVRAVFDAAPNSLDGGALLLRQVDRRLGLLDSLAAVLPDPLDPRHVEHMLVELLQQRVYGIALGYEDCNDATTLRRDRVLKTCCGRDPFSDDNLASQPTLSRLENEAGPKSCYLLARVILESYFVRHPKRPRRLILDLDTTADPTHQREGAPVYLDAISRTDECYVARGEACENSIKDLKNVLKADRLSCHRFWANQFRLLLHSAAYVLMYERM